MGSIRRRVNLETATPVVASYININKKNSISVNSVRTFAGYTATGLARLAFVGCCTTTLEQSIATWIRRGSRANSTGRWSDQGK